MNGRTDSILHSKLNLRNGQRPNNFSGIKTVGQALFGKEVLFLNLLGFLLGRASLMGELAPFGFAYFAALLANGYQQALAGGIFVFLGVLTVSTGFSAIQYLTVICLGLLFSSFLWKKLAKKTVYLSLLVFVLTLVTRLAMSLVWEPSLYNYMLAVFEAFLMLVLAFIFSYGIPVISKKANQKVVSTEELSCLAVIFAIALLGLGEWQIGDISLRGIISDFLIMALAVTAGGGIGAAMGVTVGVAVSMSNMVAPLLVGLYAFSGLLAGIFKQFGKLGAGLGFITGSLILSFYINQPIDLVAMLLEAVIAMAILMLIPRRQLSSLAGFLPGTVEHARTKDSEDKRLRELLSSKLNDFAYVFQGLARSFEQISASEAQAKEDQGLTKLFNTIACRVCETCPSYKSCWEDDFYRTYKTLLDLLTLAEIQGVVNAEHLPGDMRRRCKRLKDLLAAVNSLFEMYKINYQWRKRVAESRDLVAEQLKGLAQIMRNLSGEIKHDFAKCLSVEEDISAELQKIGFRVDKVSVTSDSDGRKIVEVAKPSCQGYHECAKGILPSVEQILNCQLSVDSAQCGVVTGKTRCSFNLIPVPSYSLVKGVACAAKDGSNISGDNYAFLPLKDGKYAVILSDGMGVGLRAAQESNATVNMLAQLLETGFDKELAVRTVNSVLLLRSPEEVFATVDLMVMDLYNGEAEFLKIGAAPSFIKRVKEVETIKSASLPVGILNHIEVESTTQICRHGDYIVMLTDGVLDSKQTGSEKEEWVARTLRRSNLTDPQRIAELILAKAKENTCNEIKDDMTVLVIQVQQCTETPH